MMKRDLESLNSLDGTKREEYSLFSNSILTFHFIVVVVVDDVAVVVIRPFNSTIRYLRSRDRSV